MNGWGYFVQGNDNVSHIDALGSRLSLAINCPVHFPAFGKRMFECKCGRTFPVFVVEGHTDSELAAIHSSKENL